MDSLETVTGVEMDGLQADREFSEVRIVRNGLAVAAGFRLGSGRYCRRIWPPHNQRAAAFVAGCKGELEETRYFLILSRDLGYVAAPGFEEGRVLCDSVGQLSNALGRTLKLSRHESRFTSQESRVLRSTSWQAKNKKPGT
jgi:hypothetical protein